MRRLKAKVARREADLKEADAKYHAAFEARNQVVHGAERTFIESGVRTVDPDADSAALFRIMGETLAPHHEAVTQTEAELTRLQRGPLVSNEPAITTQQDRAGLRACGEQAARALSRRHHGGTRGGNGR